MKKEYTKEIHAARLIKMLESNKKFNWAICPACKDFRVNAQEIEGWGYTVYGRHAACTVCKEFLSVLSCPCFALKSCAEAAKRSWLKLEEEGYI